jgi:hypothetical protein
VAAAKEIPDLIGHAGGAPSTTDDLLESRLTLGKVPDPGKKLQRFREDILAYVGAEKALHTAGQEMTTEC